MDELIGLETIPEKIRLEQAPLNLPPAKSEFDYLNILKQTASKNKVYKSFIGQGYYSDVIVPERYSNSNITRKSGLVYNNIPIPGRNSTRALTGAAQFPDHGNRPYRDGNCKRFNYWT